MMNSEIAKVKMLACFLCLTVMLNGCATVVSGKSQDVMIRSKPPGANVLIDGMISGTTPMMANLVRKKRHTVEVSHSDYPKVTRATARGFNWWYLGNVIVGGVIGLIIDPITGAIFEVKPDEIYVDFENPNREKTIDVEEKKEKTE